MLVTSTSTSSLPPVCLSNHLAAAPVSPVSLIRHVAAHSRSSRQRGPRAQRTRRTAVHDGSRDASGSAPPGAASVTDTSGTTTSSSPEEAAATPAAVDVSRLLLPDGDLGLPLVGETPAALLDPQFGPRRVARHGKLFKTSLLGSPTVMVYDGALVRRVLAGEGDFVRVEWPPATEALVGPQSVNVLLGPEHEALKRALGTFTLDPGALAHCVPLLQAAAEAYCERWAAAGSFQGLDEAKQLAFAALSGALLGLSTDPADVAANAADMDAVAGGFNAPAIGIPGTPYAVAVAARQRLEGRLVAALDRDAAALAALASGGKAAGAGAGVSGGGRQAGAAAETDGGTAANATGSRDDGSATSPSVAAILRAAHPVEAGGGGLSQQQAVDNAFAAMFGNQAAGPTLAKALQHVRGDILERLRREQAALLAARPSRSGGGGGSSDKATGSGSSGSGSGSGEATGSGGGSGDFPPLSAAALAEMPFAEACALELLRVSPAVPVVFRRALRDFELGGRRVPQGWSVWCHLGDSVLAYNADTFDPDRWLLGAAGGTGGVSNSSTTSSSGSGGGDGSSAVGRAGGAVAAVGGAGGAVAGSAGRCPFEFSLPFGSGPRACLGRAFMVQQVKVFLAVLARGRYAWECDEREPWAVVPAPRPSRGLPVTNFRKMGRESIPNLY